MGGLEHEARKEHRDQRLLHEMRCFDQLERADAEPDYDERNGVPEMSAPRDDRYERCDGEEVEVLW